MSFFVYATSAVVLSFLVISSGVNSSVTKLKFNGNDTQYEITFDPLEGSNDGVKVLSVCENTYITESQIPSFNFISGYDFSYWYELDEDTPFNLSSKLVTSDLWLSAKYNSKVSHARHKINYVFNGGDFVRGYIAPIQYEEETITPLPNMTEIAKEGYTFSGWYSNSDFDGERYVNIGVNSKSDLTFYAKWEKTPPVGYSVTFNLNGGTIKSGFFSSYNAGEEKELPNEVVREGYTFSGWYLDEGFASQKVNSILKTDSGNKVYFAKWNVVHLEFPHPIFAINYFSNGGTILDTVYKTSYKTGEVVNLPEKIVKEGYVFFGWYLDPQFETGAINELSYLALGEQNFYARWMKDNDIPFNKHYVSIYINGYRENLIEGFYESDTIISLPYDIKQKNYELVGFYDNPLKKGNKIEKVRVTVLDIYETLYPEWKCIENTK